MLSRGDCDAAGKRFEWIKRKRREGKKIEGATNENNDSQRDAYTVSIY